MALVSYITKIKNKGVILSSNIHFGGNIDTGDKRKPKIITAYNN
jgi:hypothetical protein